MSWVPHRRWGAVGVVLAAALVAAPAGQARAAPVSLSVWSGGHSSFERAHGLVLQPDGKGAVFVAPRKGGKSKRVATFKPSAAELAAIRKAARAVFKERRLVFHGASPGGEAYALATVQVGGRRDGVVAIGDAPQSLIDLFAALNVVVPPAARVATPAGRVP